MAMRKRRRRSATGDVELQEIFESLRSTVSAESMLKHLSIHNAQAGLRNENGQRMRLRPGLHDVQTFAMMVPLTLLKSKSPAARTCETYLGVYMEAVARQNATEDVLKRLGYVVASWSVAVDESWGNLDGMWNSMAQYPGLLPSGGMVPSDSDSDERLNLLL